MRVLRTSILAGILSAIIPYTYATPYWVDYSAASGQFPEDPAQGWTRYALGGGAARYFENGSLVLDDQGDGTVSDAYAWSRPGALDPGPGEVFVAQWRLCTAEIQGPWDATVGIYSDQQKAVFLQFEWDGVLDPFAGHTIAAFEPGTFHDFELRSTDMLTFDFFLDNELSYSGTFWSSVTSSLVAWGDATMGVPSVGLWTYFRFGVVPEPSALALMIWIGAWGIPRRR